MPIIRTYGCPDCGRQIEVTLRMDQWEAPPPECPYCAQSEMRQEFKPVAIGGSTTARAHKLAETIAAEDYGVADMQPSGKEGVRAKVRYKDHSGDLGRSTWGSTEEVMNLAMASGRALRQGGHGTGMDILQGALKTGAQPDLIKNSVARLKREFR